MLTLRKRSVEKRNSRGGIVRKEEVVTLTKKVHASTKAQKKKLQRPPTAFPSDTIPNPKFSLSPIPNKDTNKNPKFSLSPIPNLDTNRNPKVSLSPIPNKDTNRNPKFSLSPIPNTVHPLSKFERQIPPRGSGMQDFNRQNEVSWMEDFKRKHNQDSDVDEFKDVTPLKGSDVEDYTEDTNSEESEVEDLSSEELEAGDANTEESEVEDINFKESEVEDMSSEESEVENINSKESEVDDINSEESSEAEDSDDEPPRKLTDINRIMSNFSVGRKLTDIDRSMRNMPTTRYLTNINRSMCNLSMRR